MNTFKTRQCPGCKIILPLQENLPYEGTFARYGVASPECWALYNQFLLKEYEYEMPFNARFDAYGVQHPPHAQVQKELGVSGRYIAASKQSVAIHLVGLYLMMEKQVPLPEIAAIMNRILASGVKLENEELTPPDNLGDITIADVIKAQTKQEHVQLAWQWSKSAWKAWQKEHAKVAGWVEKYEK